MVPTEQNWERAVDLVNKYGTRDPRLVTEIEEGEEEPMVYL